ncbi:MAG: DUF6314 family protein [Pseudomonadota bacterium]
MKLAAADFAGEWRMSRQIDDLRIGESGALYGTVSFTHDGDTLRYEEKGTLVFASAAPIKAQRAYIWRFAGKHVEVAYANGAPFHSFPLVAEAAATPHLCGDDTYNGVYAFADFPQWQLTWNVTGPRKNYRTVTTFTRM